MEIQTVIVLLLFATALTYLAWRGYQSLSAKKAGCGKGCGCEADVPKQKRSTVLR